MIKRFTSTLFLLALIQLGYNQITVGSYTGITQLTNLTSVCDPFVNTVMGDIDFATNSGVEIAIGTSFTGTWATGLGYTDMPGPEILCVSVHTEEWWDVELLLSDMSFTAAVNAPMLTIEDYITLDFWDCTGTGYYNYYYDRRVYTIDFASYTIPAGLTVIGARFTLTGDNAANPDPIGMLLLQGSANSSPTISNNGPLCAGDTLELYADHVDSSTYSWIGPNSFTSNLEDPIIPNANVINAGIYTCFITDSASNIDTAYTTVIINPNPTGTFVLPNLCEQAPGIFSITGTNDTISNYLWNFGTAALNDTSILATPTFNYLSAGPYIITLEITSDEGCTSLLDTNVLVREKPSATLSNTFACVGTSQAFDPQVTADSTVTYAWTFPNGSPTSSSDSVPTINFPTSGNSMINLILTTNYGCMDTFDFAFNVSSGFNPDFGVYPICINRFTFDPLPNSADSSWVIDWNMGDGTTYNDMDTSIFNHIYTTAGTFNVQMIVTAASGCIDSVIVPVFVDDSVVIQVPNVLIQSSGVGNNKIDFEVVQPGFNTCNSYTYTVFDRWGMIVFETTNDPYNPDLTCGACFQGKTQNGATLVPGTYYYIIKGNFNILDAGFMTIFE